jgi:hypothetical protein
MDNGKFTMLDLCSGLGGASQPALDRGWRVIRLDLVAACKPDIVADVCALPLTPFPVDLLWASPPCQQFVLAANVWLKRLPKGSGGKFYRGEGPYPRLFEGEPDLSIAKAVREIVFTWPARYWVVENVWVSRKWLTPLFGPVAGLIPGHVFWGRLPGLIPLTRPHKHPWKSKSHTPGGAGAPAKTAMIPYEIGESLCRWIETASRST